MSERRPSWEARPIAGGLPRTNPYTPGFTIGAALVSLVVGAMMRVTAPTPGEWSPGMIAAFRGAGLAALALGAALAAAAGYQLRRAGVRMRAAVAGSSDAWELDYAWTPGVSRDHAVASAFEAALWMSLAAVFLGVAVRFALDASIQSPGSKLGALFLGAVAIAAALFSFPTLRRGVLFGESVLRWYGGPLRAGAEWTGTIEASRRLVAPTALLRLISETRTQDTDGNVTYRRKGGMRIDVATAFEDSHTGARLLRLTARIPAGVPATQLSRVPAVYWELFVNDEASGWTTSFLVPLYR